MNVVIQINYISKADGTKSSQSASIPLRGNNKEQLAFEFWTWIKRKIPVEIILEKVIADNEDITQLVKDLEREILKKKNTDVDNLPF